MESQGKDRIETLIEQLFAADKVPAGPLLGQFIEVMSKGGVNADAMAGTIKALHWAIFRGHCTNGSASDALFAQLVEVLYHEGWPRTALAGTIHGLWIASSPSQPLQSREESKPPAGNVVLLDGYRYREGKC